MPNKGPFAKILNFGKFLETYNFVEYEWIFKIQKLGDSEKSGESIVMNFNNVYACMHALEQKIFFWKLTISQKVQEISMLTKGLLLGMENKKYLTSGPNSFSEDL